MCSQCPLPKESVLPVLIKSRLFPNVGLLGCPCPPSTGGLQPSPPSSHVEQVSLDNCFLLCHRTTLRCHPFLPSELGFGFWDQILTIILFIYIDFVDCMCVFAVLLICKTRNVGIWWYMDQTPIDWIRLSVDINQVQSMSFKPQLFHMQYFSINHVLQKLQAVD